MIKVKYYLFSLIITFFACNSGSVQGPGDDSEGRDTTSVSAVESVSIILPEADFTNPNFVAEEKHSKAIIGRLEGLINATRKGASIYMSIYLFKNEFGLISAIKKADKQRC